MQAVALAGWSPSSPFSPGPTMRCSRRRGSPSLFQALVAGAADLVSLGILKSMNIYLRVAGESDLDQVLAYVRAYHEFEGVTHSDIDAASAVRPLLGQSTLGRVWLICLGSQSIGHIAICFGYSIEFSGRDAVVDEIFIVPEHRRKGFGKAVLALVKSEAALLGVQALHLEVARSNESARRLYQSAGFAPRERFFVMSALLESTAAQQGAPADVPASASLRQGRG